MFIKHYKFKYRNELYATTPKGFGQVSKSKPLNFRRLLKRQQTCRSAVIPPVTAVCKQLCQLNNFYLSPPKISLVFNCFYSIKQPITFIQSVISEF